MSETYLGDGLYASDDGYMITLRAPRSGGDHFVSLEPEIFSAFLRFIEKAQKVEIKVKRIGPESADATGGDCEVGQYD